MVVVVRISNVLAQCLIVICLSSSALCKYFEKDLTFTVDAGTSTCLYEVVEKDQVVEVEYQVIDGGHGELDINMRCVEPGGRILFADYKKSDNSHRFAAHVDGDHMFCFDNTISHYNTKTVYFDLIIDADKEDDEADYTDIDKEMQLKEGSQEYVVRVGDILKIVGRVGDLLSRAQHSQRMLSNEKTQDRNIAEDNCQLVQTWSILQIITMLIVGLIQVVMVRSLFDDSSRVHTMWKKLPSRLT